MRCFLYGSVACNGDSSIEFFFAKCILGWWLSRTSVHKMIQGTWNWHRNNLKRYETKGGKQ